MKNLIQNILLFTLLSITNAAALIEIDITEGNREPLPIAITNFFSLKMRILLELFHIKRLSLNFKNILCASFC